MGRRSNFLRIDEDAYDTPPEAALPLLPYLQPRTRFIEPCGGKGALTAAVEAHGHQCVYTIAPRAPGIIQRDALDLVVRDVLVADMIITNPPWTRKLLHSLGKDDAAWFKFEAFETQTVFIGKPATDKAHAAGHRASAPALTLARSAPPPKLDLERQKEFAPCHRL